MAVKWKSKGKQSADRAQSDTQSSRISNKLGHVLVVEDKQPKKRSLKKIVRDKRVLIGALVLLLAFVGAFVVLRKEPPKEEKKPYVSSEGVAIRKLSDSELKTEVDRLVFQKKFNSARELIDFQDNAGSRENQLLRTTTYLNQKNYTEAIKSFQRIESTFGDDWAIARGIGEQYENLGNKEQALRHYKKALDLLKKTDNVPVKQDEIYFLEENIKRVEG